MIFKETPDQVETVEVYEVIEMINHILQKKYQVPMMQVRSMRTYETAFDGPCEDPNPQGTRAQDILVFAAEGESLGKFYCMEQIVRLIKKVVLERSISDRNAPIIVSERMGKRTWKIWSRRDPSCQIRGKDSNTMHSESSLTSKKRKESIPNEVQVKLRPVWGLKHPQFSTHKQQKSKAFRDLSQTLNNVPVFVVKPCTINLNFRRNHKTKASAKRISKTKDIQNRKQGSVRCNTQAMKIVVFKQDKNQEYGLQRPNITKKIKQKHSRAGKSSNRQEIKAKISPLTPKPTSSSSLMRYLDEQRLSKSRNSLKSPSVSISKSKFKSSKLKTKKTSKSAAKLTK